jgi:hypothetical protein
LTQPLPATVTETLYRGDTRVWEDVIEENTGTADAPVWTPKDLTGYTFRCQLRSDPDATDVMATIAVDLVSDGTDGKIRRTLTATEAAKLAPGKVYFDLEATRTADGFVHTYLTGKWTVKPDVSRG